MAAAAELAAVSVLMGALKLHAAWKRMGGLTEEPASCARHIWVCAADVF